MVNIVWMIYATAAAYNDGNPSNIFRPIISSTIVCGGKDSLAKDYPYVYYSNPTDMLNKRYCVQSCPTFASSGAIPATWPAYGAAISFEISVDSSGTASASISAVADDVGYDSTVAIERVCIPSLTVFKGAFSSYTSQFSALAQGDLANFILDIKNVSIVILRTGSTSSQPLASPFSSPLSSCTPSNASPAASFG